MKSLKYRFNKMSNKYKNLSSYEHFYKAIQGQNFNKEVLLLWFNKLVDKDDYSGEIKKAILNHLYKSNNEKL